jgi:hypothetical protein
LLDETNAGAALEACRSIDYDLGRARALSAIIPRLGERDRQNVVTEVLSILIEQRVHAGNLSGSGKEVGETLAGIAKYLDAAEIKQAATVAATMPYNENGFFAYLALGAAAPVDERPALLRWAMNALSGVRDKQKHHRLLSELTPYLTLELLYPVIEAASEGGSQDYIDELVDQLPEPYRILAFEAAIRLESQVDRYQVAARILRRIPEHQHALALLTSLTYIRESSDHFRLLANLSSCITTSVLPVVLMHVRLLLDEHGVAEAIRQMVPGLSEDAADQVLESALEFEHEGAPASALVALAPRISVSAIGRVLSVVGRLGVDQDRARVLISIIPRVPPDLVQATSSAVRKLASQRSRVEGLLALSAGLPDPDKVAMATEALSLVSGIGNRFDQMAGIIACVNVVEGLMPGDRDPFLLACLRHCITLREDSDFVDMAGFNEIWPIL